jgi:hypothetical protein
MVDGQQMKRRTIPTEAQEQMAVVQWFASYAPTRGLDARLLCCSANGAVLAGDARMRAIQMNRLKKMGLVVGDPDLFLRKAISTFSGLYIEMKRSNWSGEKWSDHDRTQASVRSMLGVDYAVRLCCGADEAIKDIKEYLAL